MPSTTNTIPSPCKGICNLDFATHTICQGCGRNVEEIRDWETFPEFQKKIINVTNWLKGYDIRQKNDKINVMSADSKQKIKDIQGRLITIQSLIEMVGKDMIDEFGKDPIIKESYKALFDSRELILESKEHFPQES